MTETIQKAYKFRLYPNREQQAYFRRVFGCCRFVYNHFLQARIDAYERSKQNPDLKPLSFYDTSKMLTTLKKETVDADGVNWLCDVDATALVYELRNLDSAYQNFFRRVKRGENPGFPKFKSRYSDRKSFKTAGKGVVFDEGRGRVRLPKVGWVRCVVHREVEGRIVSATVSTDNTGEWHISVQCDGVPAPQVGGRAAEVAVEVGVAKLAVTSDGEVFELPSELDRLQKRLEFEQQRLSRMKGAKKGEAKSNRYLKQRRKVAKLHKRIARIRLDALHNASRRIADNYETVYMRENDLAGLLENKGEEGREVPRFVEQRQHRELAGMGLAELRRQVEYKEAWTGGELVLIDSLAPTTQRCSACGFVNRKLAGAKGLSVREWTCPECGARHDRELNSAENLIKEGRTSRRS